MGTALCARRQTGRNMSVFGRQKDASVKGADMGRQTHALFTFAVLGDDDGPPVQHFHLHPAHPAEQRYVLVGRRDLSVLDMRPFFVAANDPRNGDAAYFPNENKIQQAVLHIRLQMASIRKSPVMTSSSACTRR